VTIAVAVLALLAGAFGALKLHGDEEVRRAESTYPPRGQLVEVEGIRLHYLRQGADRPVVLLHGAHGTTLDFAGSTLPRLAEDHDVLAFDRPGHGYSERPAREPATPEVQARLLRAALVTLGVRRPVLVGHSWSGALVLAYALAYPDDVAAVVVLAGVVYLETDVEPPGAGVARVPLVRDLFVATLLGPVGRQRGPALLERAFLPDPLPADYARASLAMTLRPSQFKANLEDLRLLGPTLAANGPRYRDLHLPLVIVTGDADALVKPERQAFRLHQDVPGSRLLVLAGTGHQIPQTRPEAVAGAVQLAVTADARPDSP
jgi:pimeloyl-ACP methyl ester carboxylesterase